MQRLNGFAVSLIVATLWFAAAGGHAQSPAPEPAQGSGPNLEITITVGRIAEGSQAESSVHSYRMVAREGGPPVEMLMGWRTPIPTTRKADDGEAPVTAYVYQNIGMSASLRTRLVEDGRRILCEGEIEISGMREPDAKSGAPPDMPIIGTFQQALHVLLTPGKPLRVAQAPDPEGGARYLELTAERLD